MPNISIQITNLAQIRAAFSQAPVLMAGELNLAIRKAVLNIQGQSMINTPVLTGRLRASTSSQFGNLRGEVGTHTDYDVYIHEGTRYMSARPYLRDAVDETASQTDEYFKDAVQNVLDKIGRQV